MEVQPSKGIQALKEKRGALAGAARALGLSRSAAYQWRDVPAEHVVAIESATGIPRERLRPDLYRPTPILTPAPDQASAA